MSDWSLEILMYAHKATKSPRTPNTNWKKQTLSNLQPKEKDARDRKTSCKKKKMSAARKQIEESAEYKIF